MAGMIRWETRLLHVKAPASGKFPFKVWKLTWDQIPGPGPRTRPLGHRHHGNKTKEILAHLRILFLCILTVWLWKTNQAMGDTSRSATLQNRRVDFLRQKKGGGGGGAGRSTKADFHTMDLEFLRGSSSKFHCILASAQRAPGSPLGTFPLGSFPSSKWA